MRFEPQHSAAELLRKMLVAPQWLMAGEVDFLESVRDQLLKKKRGEPTERQEKTIRDIYGRFERRQKARFVPG